MKKNMVSLVENTEISLQGKSVRLGKPYEIEVTHRKVTSQVFKSIALLLFDVTSTQLSPEDWQEYLELVGDSVDSQKVRIEWDSPLGRYHEFTVSGTFNKRITSATHKLLEAMDLESEGVLSSIGSQIAEIVNKFSLLPRRLNVTFWKNPWWKAGNFGDRGSCLWNSDRLNNHGIMQNNGWLWATVHEHVTDDSESGTWSPLGRSIISEYEYENNPYLLVCNTYQTRGDTKNTSGTGQQYGEDAVMLSNGSAIAIYLKLLNGDVPIYYHSMRFGSLNALGRIPPYVNWYINSNVAWLGGTNSHLYDSLLTKARTGQREAPIVLKNSTVRPSEIRLTVTGYTASVLDYNKIDGSFYATTTDELGDVVRTCPSCRKLIPNTNSKCSCDGRSTPYTWERECDHCGTTYQSPFSYSFPISGGERQQVEDGHDLCPTCFSTQTRTCDVSGVLDLHDKFREVNIFSRHSESGTNTLHVHKTAAELAVHVDCKIEWNDTIHVASLREYTLPRTTLPPLLNTGTDANGDLYHRCIDGIWRPSDRVVGIPVTLRSSDGTYGVGEEDVWRRTKIQFISELYGLKKLVDQSSVTTADFLKLYSVYDQTCRWFFIPSDGDNVYLSIEYVHATEILNPMGFNGATSSIYIKGKQTEGKKSISPYWANCVSSYNTQYRKVLIDSYMDGIPHPVLEHLNLKVDELTPESYSALVNEMVAMGVNTDELDPAKDSVGQLLNRLCDKLEETYPVRYNLQPESLEVAYVFSND